MYFVTACVYCVPEKSLAALTCHSVEVKACGLVPTYSTDPRYVPIKLVRGQTRGTNNSGLHH